ncbi:MAG TPA: FAA hydrolase family protein [Sutterella sp.]|nr:FAA hydrolase family protein [Sutterella sp.]
MAFLFAPPAQAVIPVRGTSDLFPVRRVYGAAKNYAADAAARDAKKGFNPPIFLKAPDGIVPVQDGTTYRWPMPPHTAKMVPEFELVACLGRGGRNLTLERAQECIWGWCVGYDFTRRLAPKDRPDGAPWDLMKTLDGGAPVSAVCPAQRTKLPSAIRLYRNHELMQDSSTDLMIASPAELLVQISRYWELQAGDIVFTGAPVNVPDAEIGDLFEGHVEGVGSVKVQIVSVNC